MSCVQVDWTLVFMVWMESQIEVLDMRRKRGNLVSHTKSKVDIMVFPISEPHNGYTDTDK